MLNKLVANLSLFSRSVTTRNLQGAYEASASPSPAPSTLPADIGAASPSAPIVVGHGIPARVGYCVQVRCAPPRAFALK